jgi:DNA-binding NtrC family response regulator
MSTLASVSNQAETVLGSNPIAVGENEAPTVLIVSADAEVRDSLAEILEGHRTNIDWVRGAEAAKRLFDRGRVAACLCGFSVEDGSYRDVVKHAKRQSAEVPVIIVSTPDCPNEYGEYLAAMNTGAFDFLCYPYQKGEVERILGSALTPFHRVNLSRHF